MSNTPDELPEVRFLDVVKPSLTATEAHEVLGACYGLDGALKPLDSERDCNFRVSGADGRRYLLKISNAAEPREIIDLEIAALRHVEITAPDLPVPRLLPTINGKDYATTTSVDGTIHVVRLLTFLPGSMLAGIERTQPLLADLGRTSAQLAIALRGFFHAAAGGRNLLWDVRELGALRPLVTDITEPATRQLIDDGIEYFLTAVRPRLSALRSQVLHMDLHEYNLVVDPKQPRAIGGILDFGDLHHGALIQDVGIALANVMHPAPDPFERARTFLRSYHHVLPLEDVELELLYDLLLAYYTTCYLILLRREGTIKADGALGMLRTLRQMGRANTTALFRGASGVPRPRDIAVGDRAALVERRKQVMGEPLYVFYDPPLNIVRGEGLWLYDALGNAWLDVYNNVPTAGHAHPYVVQAIARQTARLSTNTRYICDEIIAYAERLTDTLADGLDNAFFVNSGSEANDLAWQMATAYTGNYGAIVVEDAYHGWTVAVNALSPSNKADAPLARNVRTIPSPEHFRSGMNADEWLVHCSAAVNAAIASLAKDGLQPALCIVDSAFCSNGIPDVLPGYLEMLFGKVRAAGGLCVADEVQSGFGRLGTAMWGHVALGAVPDIVTFGKPMANGYPMGAAVTRPDILAAASAGGSIFATFGGNNVAAAAACAVLDVFEHDDLLGNSHTTGNYLRAQLRMLAKSHPCIGEIRGSGLISGVELVTDRDSRSPAGPLTRRVLQRLSELGIAAGVDGPHGNVLKLRPPLVFQPTHADRLLDRLDSALHDAAQG